MRAAWLVALWKCPLLSHFCSRLLIPSLATQCVRFAFHVALPHPFHHPGFALCLAPHFDTGGIGLPTSSSLVCSLK